MAKKSTSTAAAPEVAPIDPAASYDVTFKRPVRDGLAIYRPCDRHVMTGAAVLAALAAAGGDPDDVLSATLVAATGG